MKSPTRRTALAASVAFLLVTAGCLGGTDPSGTSTSSASDTTDVAENCTYNASTSTATATGTWSPDASVEQYPPGVADNGTLANASLLVDAHFAATANESTELSVDWESPSGDVVHRIVYSPDPATYYSTFDGTTPHSDTPKTEKLYVTGSQHYLQFIGENETLNQVGQNTSSHGSAWTRGDTLGSPQNSLERFLARGNYTVNGTVERDGRTFVQLTADEGPSEWALDSVTAYDGAALVRPDGVVYEIDEFLGTGANGTVEKRYEGSMTLDTDVEWCGAPSWTADIPQLSVSLTEDGHAVEIRNTGGAALPANTSFNVYGREEPTIHTRIPVRSEQSGTVTTDARLEPGDAVYVTAGADGSPSSFALHDDPTRGEYTFGAAGVTGGNESVGYRLLTGVTTPEWEE